MEAPPKMASHSSADSEHILQLLASEEPPTGQQMLDFSVKIKASIHSTNVHEFTAMVLNNIPVFDARSPGEFALGHIPGANNLPLFSDDERASVGTLFNTSGRANAMVSGMAIVQPKLDTLVATAAAVLNGGTIMLLHCWRGGMRSCALAFLMQTRIPGLRVHVLKGGYKAFRAWQRSVYCYLPMNASYDASQDVSLSSFSSSGFSGGGGKRKRKSKQKETNARLKRAAREASASGVGIARREAAIAKARAQRGEEDAKEMAAAKIKFEKLVEDEKIKKNEWNINYKPGPTIVIIGGRTGSGKTKVLHALRDVLGEQVIDLEGTANHSGSAFGFVGHTSQPTPQQFTNMVAMEWASLDPERWVFVEDEGPNIGRVSTPVGLYRLMRASSIVLKLNVTKNVRVQVLREDYAVPEKRSEGGGEGGEGGEVEKKEEEQWLSSMIQATRTLEKRIGRVRMEAMILLLQSGNYAEFASTALEYYDDLYDRHISNEHGSANMREGMSSGSVRTAAIRVVNVVETAEKFDAVAVAQQVLMVLEGTKRGKE